MTSRDVLLTGTLALAIGTAIGYVDSRPTWDDTGVTAATLLLTSAALSAARPRSAWVVGILLALPLVLFHLLHAEGFGSVIAMALPPVGAAIGWGVRSAMQLSR